MHQIPSDSDARGRVDSKFRYVLVVAHRAEQLMRGARSKQETSATDKPTSVAQTEIDDGLIEWDFGPAPEISVEEAEAAAEQAEAGPDDTDDEAAAS